MLFEKRLKRFLELGEFLFERLNGAFQALAHTGGRVRMFFKVEEAIAFALRQLLDVLASSQQEVQFLKLGRRLLLGGRLHALAIFGQQQSVLDIRLGAPACALRPAAPLQRVNLSDAPSSAMGKQHQFRLIISGGFQDSAEQAIDLFTIQSLGDWVRLRSIPCSLFTIPVAAPSPASSTDRKLMGGDGAELAGVELIAVTTTSDDQGRRTGYVRRALKLAGREDIPVAAGVDVSLGCYRVRSGLPEAAIYWTKSASPAPTPLDEALALLESRWMPASAKVPGPAEGYH